MSSGLASRTGVSIAALSRNAHQPAAFSSASSLLLLLPRNQAGNAVHSTAQSIDSSNDTLAQSIDTQTTGSHERRSPYPITRSFQPLPYSKPGHSTQYDPSRAPITPSPAVTLERPRLNDHLRELLPLFAAQTPHYATIHIHGKPYLVTAGDTVRLPFLMHGVAPGDILRFNRATILGSREWTLQGGTLAGSAFDANQDMSDGGAVLSSQDASAPSVAEEAKGSESSRGAAMTSGAFSGGVVLPGQQKKGPAAYVDERLYIIRAVVMGTESEPLRIKEKKKQRNRHTKTVKSKHRFTILRIKELEVKSGDGVGFESV